MTSDRISSFTANLVGRTIAYAIDDVERDRFRAPLRVATPRETHSRQLLFQVVSDLGERHSDTAEEVHPQLAGTGPGDLAAERVRVSADHDRPPHLCARRWHSHQLCAETACRNVFGESGTDVRVSSLQIDPPAPAKPWIRSLLPLHGDFHKRCPPSFQARGAVRLAIVSLRRWGLLSSADIRRVVANHGSRVSSEAGKEGSAPGRMGERSSDPVRSALPTIFQDLATCPAKSAVGARRGHAPRLGWRRIGASSGLLLYANCGRRCNSIDATKRG